MTNAASILQSLGHLDEALALKGAVVRRDPANVVSLLNLGNAEDWRGRNDAAIASYRTVLRLNRGRGGAQIGLGVALLLKGDAATALAEIEQETSEFWRMVLLPLAYHALGRGAESDAALAALVAKQGDEDAFNISFVHAFRGEADGALLWLEKAAERGESIADISNEPSFENLRSDPRWLPFLRKLGKAPEQLAKIEFEVPLPKQ